MKSKGEWRKQQNVTSFGGSISDVHGDIKAEESKSSKERHEGRESWKCGLEKDLKTQERLRFCGKRLEVQISMLGRVNTRYIRLDIYWGKQPKDRLRRS